MKIEQTKLLIELRNKTTEAKSQLEKFKTYSIEDLNYKPSESNWIILECMSICDYMESFIYPK